MNILKNHDGQNYGYFFLARARARARRFSKSCPCPCPCPRAGTGGQRAGGHFTGKEEHCSWEPTCPEAVSKRRIACSFKDKVSQRYPSPLKICHIWVFLNIPLNTKSLRERGSQRNALFLCCSSSLCSPKMEARLPNFAHKTWSQSPKSGTW